MFKQYPRLAPVSILALLFFAPLAAAQGEPKTYHITGSGTMTIGIDISVEVEEFIDGEPDEAVPNFNPAGDARLALWLDGSVDCAPALWEDQGPHNLQFAQAVSEDRPTARSGGGLVFDGAQSLSAAGRRRNRHSCSGYFRGRQSPESRRL
jgi:hypothetical protein